MENMLYEAAFEGSVPTLLELLQQDRLILDKATMNFLFESPLHVAVWRGHVDFVKEILGLKPELSQELDSKRCSALHIASLKGYVDIVKVLLQVNLNMCLGRDMDGRNPLHLAVMKGHIDILKELVKAVPLATSATTIWGETIFHLCVKHNQLEALKFLLGKVDDPELLNAKDDYGMTILHLAVAGKQIEAIKILTTNTIIKMDAVNVNGLTALDILAQSNRDMKDWKIGELLRCAGAVNAKDIQLSANEPDITETNRAASHDKRQQGQDSENFQRKDDGLEKMKNTLMVVASLIASMAYQAAVNPPKSPGQDTFQSPTTFLAPGPNPPERISPRQDSSQDGAPSDIDAFLISNSIGFMASLSIILLLVSGLPLRRRLFMWTSMVIIWVAIIAMALAYYIVTEPFGFSRAWYFTVSFILLWVLGLGAILFLGHITRLIVKMVKYIKN